MKLQDIDKARYDKHFKIVFAAIAVFLMGGAVGSTIILIDLFGEPGGSNLVWNMLGVAIAVAAMVFILVKLRPHPFMTEVVYVWDLKQVLNRIYRKEKKIKAASDDNDPDAMVILNFFYKGSKQLYELDNNLITLEELVDKIRAHDKHMEAAGLSTSTGNFDPSILERY